MNASGRKPTSSGNGGWQPRSDDATHDVRAMAGIAATTGRQSAAGSRGRPTAPRNAASCATRRAPPSARTGSATATRTRPPGRRCSPRCAPAVPRRGCAKHRGGARPADPAPAGQGPRPRRSRPRPGQAAGGGAGPGLRGARRGRLRRVPRHARLYTARGVVPGRPLAPTVRHGGRAGSGNARVPRQPMDGGACRRWSRPTRGTSIARPTNQQNSRW